MVRLANAMVMALVLGVIVAATSRRVSTQMLQPTVGSPIARTSESRGYPFYSTPMDLAKVGYQEEEYFVEGVATR